MESLKIILMFLVVNVILYLLGSFIALDLNPSHWGLFTTTIGRIFFIVGEFVILIKSIEFQ